MKRSRDPARRFGSLHVRGPGADPAGAQAAGLDALWALTGLAAFAHGDSPTAERLREVALSEGVDPIAAVRGLRW